MLSADFWQDKNNSQKVIKEKKFYEDLTNSLNNNVEKLNCKVSYFQDCFTPLSGAYGVGRTFTHTH